jgi:hypothetical protein
MPTAVADAYNRDGVRPVLRSLFTSDHLEGARWDDVNSELDGQGGSDSTLLGRRRGPRNGTIHQDRSPPLQRAVVDRAALDQVFAQSADEMDLDTVDDN